MKKILEIAIGIVLLITLIVFGYLKYNETNGTNGTNKSNETNETIRVADKNGLEIVPIKDKNTIDQIKKIVDSIKYINEDLNMGSKNDDYTIWLENKNSQNRVFNLSIWDNNNGSMVIFNPATFKYGYINGTEKETLKSILNKYIRNDG